VYEGVGSRYIAFLVPAGQVHLQRGGSLINFPSTAFRGKDIVENFVKKVTSRQDLVKGLGSSFLLLAQRGSEGEYVLPLHLRDPEEAANKFINYSADLIEKSKDGSLYMMIGLDTLENELGHDGALEFLYHVGSWVKTNNVFCFVVLKECQKIPRRVVHLASTHSKIRPEGGSIIFYGIVPETGL